MKIKQIRDKLKEGCGKDTSWSNIAYKCGQFEDLKHSDHIILCSECKAKLQLLDEIIPAFIEDVEKLKEKVTNNTALSMLREREPITIEEIVGYCNELIKNLKEEAKT